MGKKTKKNKQVKIILTVKVITKSQKKLQYLHCVTLKNRMNKVRYIEVDNNQNMRNFSLRANAQRLTHPISLRQKV